MVGIGGIPVQSLVNFLLLEDRFVNMRGRLVDKKFGEPLSIFQEVVSKGITMV